ncbi:MAG TPA: 5-(carboxyamino)imidazole ribonucleotide synthase [Woeseiaceae bacterium]|nr:5-(carboxyamino)imidazole ribonucleotide synthase [Woeseiaceae bacterium]
MTTVGIIGAGQLGRMLGCAGESLDLEFVFLDPADNPPARTVGPVLSKPFDSAEGLAMLSRCDVVTYEFENVPVAALEELSRKVPVFPPAIALEHAQDRLREKRLFEALDIPVPAYRTVSSRKDLADAMRSIGLPLVLKTRRLGYDGKGQSIVRNEHDADRAWNAGKGVGQASLLIAEEWVPFDREVSVIGARSPGGQIVVYPMTENEHRNGILHQSKAPTDGAEALRAATRHLTELLTHLDYVGILALELFVIGSRVLANEFAPRVHNSGHWTIEGAKTSQFGNHLRAILDRPLGEAASIGHAGMINLVGSLPERPRLLTDAGFHLHEYGKEARPGRKLGHLTIVAPDAATRDQKLSNALKILGY